MQAVRPINIAYVNDQLFPLAETDAEQLMSAMSEVGKLPGARVDFVFAAKWGEKGPTAAALAEYYQVEESFDVFTQKSLFPSLRAFEKVGHAVASLRHPVFKEADLLYTRNLPNVFTALALTDKPVVYETFRPWATQRKILVPLLKKMASHKRLLGVVTHSQLAGQSFLDVGLPAQKLLVAHNGYDPKRMQPVLTGEAARASLGLPMDRPIVSYTGHVSMKKGLGMMLDLAAEMPHAEFVIVGSSGRGEVEDRAASLDNVRVVGWLPFDRIIPYLYASDVLFIPPSKGPLQKVGNTVLPLKTFQYMAAGRAIFGPDTPDLREMLEDGRNAVLVEPDNPEAARRALTALLADPEKYRALGAEAERDVIDMTWARRAEKLLAFIAKRLAAYRAAQ